MKFLKHHCVPQAVVSMTGTEMAFLRRAMFAHYDSKPRTAANHGGWFRGMTVGALLTHHVDLSSVVMSAPSTGFSLMDGENGVEAMITVQVEALGDKTTELTFTSEQLGTCCKALEGAYEECGRRLFTDFWQAITQLNQEYQRLNPKDAHEG